MSITGEGLQRLRAVDSNDLDLSSNWTLEAFVWPDADNVGEWDRFWTKWGDGGQQWHLAFRSTGAVDIENGIDFFINGGDNIVNSNTTAEVPLETWSHIAMVGNSSIGTITAWLNGEQVGSTPYEEVERGAGAMNFGNFDSPANGLQFSGLIDEALIHATAVDETYLKRRAALTMPDPGLRLGQEQVDFGAVSAGGGLQEYRLTIANPGQSLALEITAVTLTNNPDEHFSVVSSPTSVAPQSDGQIVIGFDDAGSTGSFTAELVIESNAQGQPTRAILVSARAVPSNRLLVHFKMDETEGNELIDASGNGYHGVYRESGGGTFTLNQLGLVGGRAVALDDGGTNEGAGFCEIPAEGGLPPLQTFTVSMWVQLDENDFQTSSLFSKGLAQGDPFGAVFALGGDTDPIQWFEAGNAVLVANAKFVPGMAQHVVVSRLDTDDGARVRVYLDGASLSEMEGLASYDDFTPSPLQFGATLGAFGFTGLMDDVQIYDKELSAGEVQFLFNNPGETLPSETSPQPDTDTDTDHDGSSDKDEIHAGTDPIDPSDYFRITRAERTASGTVIIEWTSVVGKRYDIEFAEVLEGPWTIIGTRTSEVGNYEDMDTLRTTRKQAHYRVRVLDDL